MVKANPRSKTANLGIDVLSVATATHSGGGISFTHPLNGNTSKYFHDGSPFHEGLAAVELSTDRWCHITIDLEPAYQARYDWVGDFSQGLAPASLGNDSFHIGRNGKIAYKNRFDHIGIFYEGLAAAKNHIGKMFHILPNGKPAYANRFHYVSEFNEGLAVVQSAAGSKFYFIDHYGLPLGIGQFEEAGPFRSGLAAVAIEEGKSYHIDHTGKPAYRSIFTQVGDFCENLATASKKAKHDDQVRFEQFHITRIGQRAYEDSFETVYPFKHGIAMVRNFSRRTAYINIHGHKIQRR